MDFDFTTEHIDPKSSTVINIGGLGALSVPTGATADRPASPIQGDFRFNTTTVNSEFYNGTEWLSNGKVLQLVSGIIPATTGTTTVATGLTAVPTIAGGFQIWTTSFTPVSASSRLLIQFNTVASHATSARTAITSCFAGSVNIGSVVTYFTTTNLPYCITYQSIYAPGSTTAITISARTGATASGTLSIGQYNGTTNTLGGASVTEYIIMEIL